MKLGPKAEGCFSKKSEQEQEKREKLLLTYQLYFLCRVRGLGAFVCLFVSHAEGMDAISLAIQAGGLCREPQVIFHVKN